VTLVLDPLYPSVVVFSPNYLPLNRINLRRAVNLLITEKAEPLESLSEQFWEIRAANLVLQVPVYIRLKKQGAERIWKIPPVNRREVLRRDKYQCQYCGSRKHLTLDHVIPRSKGGAHSWDNVVTACEACNSRKGDRLLADTGMKLKTPPKAPMHPAFTFAEQFWRNHAPTES
jgi:5-methylcytosine-specific restriction endonuclease McrA